MLQLLSLSSISAWDISLKFSWASGMQRWVVRRDFDVSIALCNLVPLAPSSFLCDLSSAQNMLAIILSSTKKKQFLFTPFRKKCVCHRTTFTTISGPARKPDVWPLNMYYSYYYYYHHLICTTPTTPTTTTTTTTNNNNNNNNNNKVIRKKIKNSVVSMGEKNRYKFLRNI
jgi:hypothetical protein